MDIEVLCRNAVSRALDTVCKVAVLIANENIVGLFFFCFFNPFFAYTFNVFGLFFVIRFIFFIRILQGFLIIGGRKYAFNGRCIASGNHSAIKILLVFNAVFRHQTTPISIRIFRIFVQNIVKFHFRFGKLR